MSTEALVPTNGPAALALAAELGATLTAVSLEVTDPNLPFQSWENLGRCISFAGNAWQWWVGDWIRIGETLYGEDAAQAVDDSASRYDVMRRVTGVEQQTLLNVASVARKVAPFVRRPELRFSHHAVVAPFEEEDQVLWLHRAVDNQWTVAELRQAIRDEKSPPPPEDEGETQISPSGGTDTLTLAERLEEVARLIWNQAQPTTHGTYEVPAPAMSQLAEVLGEA